MSSTTTFPTTFFEKCRQKMAKNAETTSRNRPFLPQNVVKNVVILSSDNMLSENSARRHFPTTDRPWGRAEPGQQRYKRNTVTIEPRRLRDDKAKNYDISSPRLERREKSSMSALYPPMHSETPIHSPIHTRTKTHAHTHTQIFIPQYGLSCQRVNRVFAPKLA